MKGAEDFRRLCDDFTEAYSARYSPEATFPVGGVNVECFYLTATVESARLEIKPRESGTETPAKTASREPRQAYWTALGGFNETPVFAFEALEPRNEISGPALIESVDTTFVVEHGWRFTLDQYGNGVLERD